MSRLAALLFALVAFLPSFAADPIFDQQAALLAQFEPRYVQGLVGWYSASNPGDVTLNGAGVSALRDQSGLGHDLLQATAANQPLISRTDNAGNLLVRSEEFENSQWIKSASGTGSTPIITTNSATDPFGGTAAERVQLALNGGTTFADQSWLIQNVTLPPTRPVTEIWMRANSGGPYTISLGSSSGGEGNVTVTSSWQLFTRTNSLTTGGSHGFRVGLRGGYVTSDLADLLLYGASMRQSEWSPAYVPTGATIQVPGLNGLATAYFDGVDDFLKTAAFTLNQPTFVVMMVKTWTWTLNDTLIDGNTLDSGKVYQSATTPSIRMTAGTPSSEVPLTVGSWAVVSVGFDGANSFVRVNRQAPVVSAAGAGNMGGLTLGANGTPGEYFNGQLAEILPYNRIPSAAEQDYIALGLAAKWGIAP